MTDTTDYMDQLKGEGLLPLLDALAENGVRTSTWTALRWARHGARGHRLEALRIGHRYYSTAAAVARWLKAQQVALGKQKARRPADNAASPARAAQRKAARAYLESVRLGVAEP